MKGYYRVEVQCEEGGRTVGAGEYGGVAGSIQEAIDAAVALAREAGGDSESGHRAVEVKLIGPIDFGE